MIFKKISSEKDTDFKEAWKIYEDSFPSDERRRLKNQIEILDNKLYSLYAIHNKSTLIGVLDTWNFDRFIFIEHLAIREELRWYGLGSRLLKEFMHKKNTRFFIAEVERPETDIAKRRIKFWENIGFKLNRYNYIQPAYDKNKNPVSMFLMSYPKEISESEYIKIRREIHTKVYGCKKPLHEVLSKNYLRICIKENIFF